jgi:hypothetical protein
LAGGIHQQKGILALSRIHVFPLVVIRPTLNFVAVPAAGKMHQFADDGNVRHTLGRAREFDIALRSGGDSNVGVSPMVRLLRKFAIQAAKLMSEINARETTQPCLVSKCAANMSSARCVKDVSALR